MKSWQTTVSGLGVIAAGVVLIIAGGSDNQTETATIAAALVAAGVGLIKARDNGVSSEKAGAK